MSESLLALTAKIVAAHVAKNATEPAAVPGLIQTVYQSLSSAGTESEPPPQLTPAVPVKRSVFPDYIVCLEDGKKLKMLKRHLKTSYNMTPEEYRAKWGLSREYPMVAPSYAATRSTLAKSIGLGRKPVERAEAPEPTDAPEPPEPPVTKLPAKRAKGSKR